MQLGYRAVSWAPILEKTVEQCQEIAASVTPDSDWLLFRSSIEYQSSFGCRRDAGKQPVNVLDRRA